MKDILSFYLDGKERALDNGSEKIKKAYEEMAKVSQDYQSVVKLQKTLTDAYLDLKKRSR